LPLEELDWSGKGQFVEFKPGDEVPLTTIRDIASTATAVVDEVQCRRIRLARKTMLWRPEVAFLKSALDEIKHLRHLDHSHIVRIVGAYVQGQTISTLTYPVADWNLAEFMKLVEDTYGPGTSNEFNTDAESDKVRSLAIMPGCLIHALGFIHESSIRHLDIKPQNILVMERHAPLFHSLKLLMYRHYKVYICDFGISTTISSENDTKTYSPTPRTQTYCAPEVYEDDAYGRAADIFSLGCVFAEMYTCLHKRSTEELAELRANVPKTLSSSKRLENSDIDRSFHANQPRVVDWLRSLPALDDEDGLEYSRALN
jgi:serine/threonine protein kinase